MVSGRTGVRLPRHFQWGELVDFGPFFSGQAGFSGLAAWACLWALPPALTQRLDSETVWKSNVYLAKPGESK